MRKQLTFFLTLLLLLSLASSCQRTEGEDPQIAQTSADSSQADSIETGISSEEMTSTTLPNDCDNPPEAGDSGESGALPPGFTLDPEEPDKYLYVEEWHG